MTGETFQLGRMFMERLPHQGDLLRTLNAFCGERQIKAGYLSVIGTVSRGAIAFYDQAKQVYAPLALEEELEIVNCQKGERFPLGGTTAGSCPYFLCPSGWANPVRSFDRRNRSVCR